MIHYNDLIIIITILIVNILHLNLNLRILRYEFPKLNVEAENSSLRIPVTPNENCHFSHFSVKIARLVCPKGEKLTNIPVDSFPTGPSFRFKIFRILVNIRPRSHNKVTRTIQQTS